MSLLHKASIITTPTAYGVGVLNSIKPAIPFGEELVTNGSFTVGTGWTLGANTTINTSTGKLINTNSGSFSSTTQSIAMTAGVYLVTYNIDAMTGGVFFIGFTGVNGANRNTAGSYSEYITVPASSTTLFLAPVNAGMTYTIDNVSVKKVTDADFDFTRTSSATRVNPDYLIETVSINSANLVQNGNFSELSSELVTNGDFQTDTDWTKGTGWNISGGKANCDGTQVSNSIFYQNIGNQSNKTVKFSFTISDYVSGVLETAFFGASGTIAETISANGNYTFYVAVQSGHNGNTGFTAKVGFIGSIDNVSVKQVDPNDNWTLGTGWSIEEETLKATETAGASVYVTATIDFLTAGKIYLVTYTVVSISSGSVNIQLGFQSGTERTAVGTYSEQITSDGSAFYVYTPANPSTLSISNISVIEIQENGVPRLDYTNGTASILLENQSTNSVLYSQEVDNAWWFKFNCTITPNTSISPDGTLNADTLTMTSGTSAVLYRTSLTAGSLSFFAKDISLGTATFKISVDGVGSASWDKNGLLTSVAGATATDGENYGNGWYRFTLNVTSGTVVNYGISNGTGTNSILVFGLQNEAGATYSTSYIPTSGSTITRAAETLNNAANSDLINSTEGVLYCEIAALTDLGSYRLISLSDGNLNQRITILYDITDNKIYGQCVNSTTQAFIPFVPTSISNMNKIAFKYKANDFALWVNGVEVGVDTSGVIPTGLDKLSFDRGDGVDDFYGRCKTVAVFKEALSDTELACLTSTSNREIFLNYYYRMQYVGANTEALSCAQQTFNI